MIESDAPFAMVVDDDAMIVMQVSDILTDVGFQCREAYDGQDAIDQLTARAEDVTLLFSDVDMPGSVDGFALARHVAAHWPWIEIVIASGRILPQAGELPATATFLTKPFNQLVVRQHLDRILPDGKKPGPHRHLPEQGHDPLR